MARSFTAQDLIQLPCLGAEDAIALVTQLVTAARAERTLSAAIAESLDELQLANESLMGSLRKRGRHHGVDPAGARAADLALDRAWSATESWLAGWAASDGHGHVAEARAAHARLFPEGRAFLPKMHKVEWAESQTSLDIIELEAIDRLFDALGGAHFLSSLRDAHQAFGEALGITEALAPPSQAPLIREAIEGLLGACREYVAQVAASVRRKNPETESLATRLLAPIAAWESSRRITATELAAAGTTPEAPGTTPQITAR